jgi:hypothetical protein
VDDGTPNIWAFRHTNKISFTVTTDSSPAIGVETVEEDDHLVEDEWVQITCIIKGKAMSIYYDDKLIITKDITGTVKSYDSLLYIGGASYYKGFPGAKFDNIQVFETALKIKEITELALMNQDTLDG